MRFTLEWLRTLIASLIPPSNVSQRRYSPVFLFSPLILSLSCTLYKSSDRDDFNQTAASRVQASGVAVLNCNIISQPFLDCSTPQLMDLNRSAGLLRVCVKDQVCEMSATVEALNSSDDELQKQIEAAFDGYLNPKT